MKFLLILAFTICLLGLILLFYKIKKEDDGN